MKITIDERPEASGIEVAIVCRRTDQQVLDIVARLRMFDRKVTGSADGGTYVVNAEDILYVERAAALRDGGAPGGMRLPAGGQGLRGELPQDRLATTGDERAARGDHGQRRAGRHIAAVRAGRAPQARNAVTGQERSLK